MAILLNLVKKNCSQGRVASFTTMIPNINANPKYNHTPNLKVQCIRVCIIGMVSKGLFVKIKLHDLAIPSFLRLRRILCEVYFMRS